MAALPDHGWEEFGPTNETLYAIYCTLPMYTVCKLNKSIGPAI